MCTCIKSLLLYIFCFLLGSKGERLSLRQKQSKQPITNKSKFDLLEEEHTASSDSTVKVKRLLLLYVCIKHINCLLINI